MTDAAIADTLQHLVIANRILARENVIDDFGHVSVRYPHDPARYFLSCSRSPEIVVREDLMEFMLCGSVPANDPLPMRCKSLINNIEMQKGRGHNRRRL